MSSLKLNIGSGNHRFDGYVNIDCRKNADADVYNDVLNLDFNEGVIEEIYCSNVLEHLYVDGAIKLMKKMHKWLKVGGSLFISVPDLKVVCRFIADGDEKSILWNWLYGEGQDTEGGAMNHHWGYTEEVLKQILDKYGFNVIGYFDGKDDDSTFKYNGVPLAVNLSCRKR